MVSTLHVSATMNSNINSKLQMTITKRTDNKTKNRKFVTSTNEIRKRQLSAIPLQRTQSFKHTVHRKWHPVIKQGTKCNLRFRPKNWPKTLALGAQTATSCAKNQNKATWDMLFRKRVKHPINQNIQKNITGKQEWKTTKDSKKRITEHKLTINHYITQ